MKLGLFQFDVMNGRPQENLQQIAMLENRPSAP